MKTKKIIALFVSLAMILSSVCIPAYADVIEMKSDIVLSEGNIAEKSGVSVEWKITTGTKGINTANIAFSYDTRVFDLVDSQGKVLTFSAENPPKLNDAQLDNGSEFSLFHDLYAKKGSDSNFAVVAFIRSSLTSVQHTTATTIGKCFLAYKDGKGLSDVTTSALRLATTEEAATVSQTSVVAMGYVEGDSPVEYKYGTSDSSDTEGWSENITFGKNFTFAKEQPTCSAPTGVTATYGKKLSEITLTNPVGNTEGTWTWKDGEQLVGDVSTSPNTFKATFTPTDGETYATVSDIDVQVTVSAKAIDDVTVADINDQVYTGSQITPDITVKGDSDKTLEKDKDYTVEYGANKDVGSGSVTVKAKEGGNYTFTDVTDNFNIVAQAGSIAITGTLDKTYDGSAVDTASLTVNKNGTGTVTYKFYTNEGCTEGETETPPSNAGNYWVKAFMEADTNYGAAQSDALAFTISPATISDEVKNAITGYSNAYDGASHDAVVIDTAKTTDYTIKYSDTENGTYDSNNPQVTNVSDSKTVWVEISRENYATVKKSVQAVITPIALTLKSATATARDYAKDNVNVEISGIEFNETEKFPILNTGFTATGKMNDDNAGDSKTVTVTVDLTDGNYSLEKPTTTTTVKINKIDYTGTKIASGEAKYGTSGTVDLTSMLAEGGTFGTITKTDTNNVLSGEPTVSGGNLNFTFANESSKANNTATVKVHVTSTNYNDYDIEVTLKVLDKLPQSDFKFENPAQTKVYGDVDFTVKAKGAVSGSTVTYESSAPDVATVDNDGKVHLLKASTTDVTITATASATDEYQSATATYTLKINKAKITITAKNQKIYVNGTVPDLTNPVKDTHYEVAGLVGTDALGGALEMKYSKDSSDVAVADVDVTKIGTYDILISGATAPTGGNYEDEIDFIKGTLTIETKPSSGGGSSYVPSTSTEKAAKDFVKNSMTAGGSAIKNVSKDNYKQVLEAAEKYNKLSAAEKAAVDKEMKAQTGKTMAELTAEAEAIKASVEEPTVDDKTIQDAVKDLAIKARSAKLKSGKIKVTLTGDLSALEKEGYTVKYKFYRSTRKSASYKAAVTKDAPEYLNTVGKKGTMYYYKARVMVYDKDGKLVAQSELKQCKYANRKWTK